MIGCQRTRESGDLVLDVALISVSELRLDVAVHLSDVIGGHRQRSFLDRDGAELRCDRIVGRVGSCLRGVDERVLVDAHVLWRTESAVVESLAADEPVAGYGDGIALMDLSVVRDLQGSGGQRDLTGQHGESVISCEGHDVVGCLEGSVIDKCQRSDVHGVGVHVRTGGGGRTRESGHLRGDVARVRVGEYRHGLAVLSGDRIRSDIQRPPVNGKRSEDQGDVVVVRRSLYGGVGESVLGRSRIRDRSGDGVGERLVVGVGSRSALDRCHRKRRSVVHLVSSVGGEGDRTLLNGDSILSVEFDGVVPGQEVTVVHENERACEVMDAHVPSFNDQFASEQRRLSVDVARVRVSEVGQVAVHGRDRRGGDRQRPLGDRYRSGDQLHGVVQLVTGEDVRYDIGDGTSGVIGDGHAMGIDAVVTGERSGYGDLWDQWRAVVHLAAVGGGYGDLALRDSQRPVLICYVVIGSNVGASALYDDGSDVGRVACIRDGCEHRSLKIDDLTLGQRTGHDLRRPAFQRGCVVHLGGGAGGHRNVHPGDVESVPEVRGSTGGPDVVGLIVERDGHVVASRIRPDVSCNAVERTLRYDVCLLRSVVHVRRSISGRHRDALRHDDQFFRPQIVDVVVVEVSTDELVALGIHGVGPHVHVVAVVSQVGIDGIGSQQTLDPVGEGLRRSVVCERSCLHDEYVDVPPLDGQDALLRDHHVVGRDIMSLGIRYRVNDGVRLSHVVVVLYLSDRGGLQGLSLGHIAYDRDAGQGQRRSVVHLACAS